MMRGLKRIGYLNGVMAIFLYLIIPFISSTAFGGDWFTLFYMGRLGDNVLTQITYSPHLTDSTLAALGVGRKLFQNRDYVRLELEGLLVRHSGQKKFTCDCDSCGNPGFSWAFDQSYEKSRDLSRITFYEMDGVLVLRWLKFPWSDYIDIDFAAGEGFSYSTMYPPIEEEPHSVNHGFDYHKSKFLNYLMLELTFALPQYSSWHVIYRVHHRSGDFGLINGVADGSNYLCLGIRYDF